MIIFLTIALVILIITNLYKGKEDSQGFFKGFKFLVMMIFLFSLLELLNYHTKINKAMKVIKEVNKCLN